MAPTKKGKKGGKKKSKDGDLGEENKLKLKTHEVDALKDNLALRRELTRKSKAAYEEIRDKLDDASNQIEEIEHVHKASSAYLTHQYKTMQSDMAIKMHQLETELASTKKVLDKTEGFLAQEIEEKKRVIKEKDHVITDLNQRIDNIQIKYDSTISSTLDKFIMNLNQRKILWEEKSERLQTKNKILLAELGLKIHDI